MEDPEGGREGVKASLLILHITQNIYLYIMFFAFLLIILEEVGVFFSVPRANLSDALIFDPTSF